MIISHKYKLIFIHICKNAGTFITQFLVNLDKDLDYQYIGHIKSKDAKQVLDPIIWDTYTKFCVIRNSWDFTLSLYTYTKSEKNHMQYDIVKNMSYNDYLLYISKTSQVNQVDFILDYDDNTILIDYIIDFDNLNNNLISFSQEVIKIDSSIIQKCLPNNKINKSDKEEDYTIYYDDSTVKLVSEIYNKDISFFKFKFGEKLYSEILWPTCKNSVNTK